MDCAIPILASLDFDSTVSFYQRLGFQVSARYESYLILHRKELILHFWACPKRAIAEATGCYVNTNDARAWHERCRAAGAKVSDPEETEYGMLEFALWDDSGNLLRFGERFR